VLSTQPAASCHTHAIAGAYERHCPETTLLYRTIQEHLSTLEDKDQQLTLDHLANASVQGLVATGPRRGCRALRLGGTGEDAEAAIIGKRCAEVAGFNVHANVQMRFGEGKMALVPTMHRRCRSSSARLGQGKDARKERED
jgi:hypothetical protein